MSDKQMIVDLLKGVRVKWKELHGISEIYGGLTGKNKSDFENGNAKYISYKNIFDNLTVKLDDVALVKVSITEKQHNIQLGDILFTGSSETADEVGMSSVVKAEPDSKTYLNSFSFGLRFHNDIEIVPEFTKYLFRSSFMRTEISKTASGVTRFNISKSRFKKIVIPIPPLPIQVEIVRILDKFTTLTAELAAELSMRKKQYNYYRDQLLTFKVGTFEWKTLGELVKIKNGKDWKGLETGNVPVYGTGGIIGYVNKYTYDKPTVLIPRKGSITNIFYLESPFWNVDTIYYTEIDNKQILPKFFYFYMKTIDLMKLDTGSGRPSLTQAILNEIKIPIPYPNDPVKSLAEQARIVSILDKFDTLTYSITKGLPREIELRQKQYEYYRDLLLNFPKP